MRPSLRDVRSADQTTEETRRSGRATKGQHTKDREAPEVLAAARKKGTAKKASKKAVEEEEEPEEKIRCICGEYEEETEIEVAMVCCDNCDAWQHNDCMGLPEDYSEDSYFCEECKPQNHKALLAAMKKGQKPWEQAAKRRAERIAAERAAKGKKGKKGGRKSAAAEEVETPASTPAAGQKRKAEDSPAPSESKVGSYESRAATSLTELQANNKKAKGTPQATPSAESASRSRKTATATPAEASPAPSIAKDPKELPPNRRGAATSLVRLFTDQTKIALKAGFTLPAKQTVENLGAHTGMLVENAVHEHSVTSANESEIYKTQIQAIMLNVKRNNTLGGQVVRGDVSPGQLAKMSPSDMASEEQQRRDAEMQAQLDKQSTLVGTAEEGPRIRRTHKGDEYVEDLRKPSTDDVKPQSIRQTSTTATAEIKSPTQPRRQPSVTIPNNRRPSGDPRRQSSGTFDINSVYSNVQGSPTGDQRFGELPAQPSREPAGPGARPDADIDNLLKDEDASVSSPPYSPRADGGDDTVWRGLVNGGNVGRFHNSFKFAGGAAIDAPTLRLTWEQLLPSEIGISGRIDPKKAEDYLCGLEFSNTSDLIVLYMNAPSNSEAAPFNQFFDYFKTRDRYGVGAQNHNPALKDIYFIPLEKGQGMPTFFSNLQTDFPAASVERIILIPLVIKNSELPRVGESPAVGGAVMQTPITPRESWQTPSGPDGTTNGNPTGPYTSATPVPVNGTSSQQQQQQPPSASPIPGPPPNATPAILAAFKILGPTLSQAPAVQQLCETAPTAREQEMGVVKECIADNPLAAEQLDVLTRMLTEKWQGQQAQAAAAQGGAGGQQG